MIDQPEKVRDRLVELQKRVREVVVGSRARSDLHAVNRTTTADTWFLVAGENSWTLPFLAQPGMDWQLTPRWDQVVKAREALAEPNETFALVLDTPLPKNIPFEVVKAYPPSSFILRIVSGVQNPR